MRAVWLNEFGGPEALVPGEAPDPVPGAGQAVVRVEAVNVTFVETQVRAGRSPFGNPRLPVVPGNGVGGVVVSVGDGVDQGLVGARVVSTTGGSGGYAELVAVSAGDVVPVPDGLDVRVATAVLADGRTAIGLTRLAGVASGEWVLVEAAAGGVGSLLVQLALAEGAKVVAAARGARKLDLARELGAHVVVDYTSPKWTDEVLAATGGAGVDVVFDGVGGEIGTAALRLTARGGRFVQSGLASGEWTDTSGPEVAERGVRLLGLAQVAPTPAEFRRLIVDALDAAASGRLRPVIGQTFPLERAADAHAAIEARAALGKTLLIP
ncbi:NADPH2:quinone reductase [Streptoalloteichus tenebrarius]|uniref:NADPH2:quinone reductase n=1 Tax=Streptoalloteichus tenebrarius (strain ATCC 17920 / DSM 40477 / JCM 4838 / CBS 697.72 / NBRC 16177 / NCIMB 11028 / NRRL B-12390 / A12253. 1 / ISP 5477) TaxID=1933 RepID=A0ABT1HXM0_STRSD|nr:zinc-binding dehydrogenase [Streptoalloteichus tenebrarius]MCP2260268.1 NADPH2:quinone reductase [Streptoalloteichus tenebrarius]BFF03018.1 zinc-binding dehydrogenase [Streptoalloteichus tenebrarius]